MASVVTNGAMICFTMDCLQLRSWTMFGRSWIFIGFQWTLISCQYVLSAVIPDVSLDVTVQLERQEFITSKLIDFIPDEDYELYPDGPEQITDAANANDQAEARFLKELLKKKSKMGSLEMAVAEYPLNGATWPGVVSVDTVEMTSNPMEK